MTNAPSNDEQPQNTSSQEYISPSSSQFQHDAPSKPETQKTSLPPAKLELYKNKALEEVLSQFVPFDVSQMLYQPLEEEIELDKTFTRDQAIELMEMMVETWAWNMSRISRTTQTSGQRLNEKYAPIMDTEKKQGMSDSLDSARLRASASRLPGTDWFDLASKQLQEFVRRMRSAIDALCGN